MCAALTAPWCHRRHQGHYSIQLHSLHIPRFSSNPKIKTGTNLARGHQGAKLSGGSTRGGFHKELKAVDTIGNCQRLAFTVGVSQHMHKITNLWKFYLNRSSKLRDNNERKITLVTRSCVRLDGWFRDLIGSSSKSEVSKSNSWKITSFAKTMALQREPFLTMFYTINISPLLVTKKGFVLIMILSNHQ